ncbi:hypothetical protein VPNG_07038 [Cytospora leucostoma]|uniref:Uncharacterized protein n=1 Tax=Cytospora leucostoma TaxID=1230097 RepID=A0A423WNM7_9PEZI|nr:hypothetical protein VPNG_07038 [Cytospora leucostoma]
MQVVHNSANQEVSPSTTPAPEEPLAVQTPDAAQALATAQQSASQTAPGTLQTWTRYQWLSWVSHKDIVIQPNMGGLYPCLIQGCHQGQDGFPTADELKMHLVEDHPGQEGEQLCARAFSIHFKRSGKPKDTVGTFKEQANRAVVSG